MPAPKMTLATTGSTPKVATKEDLITGVNDVSLRLYNKIETSVARLDDDISAIAMGLDFRGSWDASSGAFPSASAAGQYWIVSVPGTVDGQTFAFGDWLIASIDSPSTSTYSGNWVNISISSVSRRSFNDTAELIASPTLSVGEFYTVKAGYNGEPETFEIAAASTYTANAQEVIDLTGSGLQAVSLRMWFMSASELLADTRTFTAGEELSVPSIGAVLRATASTGNLGQTNAGGQELDVVPVGGAYPVDVFSEFSGSLTGSRDNSAIAAAVSAAAGAILRLGDGPYDFDTYPSGLDDVFIEGSPFTNFNNKKLPLFSGVFTGNKQIAIAAGVLRFYDASSTNLGSGYTDGETVNISAESGGSGGTATVSVAGSANGVASATLVSGGSGYTDGAQAELQSSGGRGCLVTLSVTSGVITGITKRSGWYFLKDASSDHDPILLRPVTATGSDSFIAEINLQAFGLDTDIWTPAGFVCGPDETLAEEGWSFGASVGITSIRVQGANASARTSYVFYNGTNWTGLNAPYTYTWTGSELNLERTEKRATVVDGSTAPVVTPFLKAGATARLVALEGFGANSFRLTFWDLATGSQVTTEDTDMKFIVSDPASKGQQFDFSEDAGVLANIWMVGVFTKKEADYPA